MSTHRMSHLDNSDYEAYEEQFNTAHTDRQARRGRKQKGRHTPKKSEHTIVTELADTLTDAAVEVTTLFETTYRPSRYEVGWLLESLQSFYQQDYITDVLALVRGGKEASVYRCAARPGMEETLLAAKVYRPRKFRQLRNDKMYREGRAILSSDGQALNQSVHGDRLQRALGKKTAYGQQVEHTSWLMHEFHTLQALYSAGAAVPKPVAAGENAILMGYVGDESMAGPTLNTVQLEVEEAHDLFREVMQQVELMLTHGWIHGDLSAYNILYWEGEITLIDFPQVTDSHVNNNARFILERDIERVCQYFAAQGVRSNPKAITRSLWKRYVERDADEVAADLSRLAPEEA